MQHTVEWTHGLSDSLCSQVNVRVATVGFVLIDNHCNPFVLVFLISVTYQNYFKYLIQSMLTLYIQVLRIFHEKRVLCNVLGRSSIN